MKYSSLILNQNNESWIFKLLENDFFKILNSQVISSLLGAVVTIFGVVLTIRHERKMREIARKDEIKPALSIIYIGIEYFLNNSGDYPKIFKKIKNIFIFAIAPILETVSSRRYHPSISMFTNHSACITNLLFLVHVDGNYPITDIKLTKINTTSQSSKDFTSLDSMMQSVGVRLPHTNSIFDFYHKQKPANFERLDPSIIQLTKIDSNMFNTYISPNSDALVEVPVRIGFATTKKLIYLINNNEEFNRKENFLDCDYPFHDPKYLYRFLSNLNKYPVQISFEFEIVYIDGNSHTKKVQAFASLRIIKMSNNGDTDFMITPNITTNATVPNDNDNLNGKDLEKFIEDEFRLYKKD